MYERIEGKAIDLIEENTPIIVGKIKDGLNRIKKSKLKINVDHKILKDKQNKIDQEQKDILVK